MQSRKKKATRKPVLGSLFSICVCLFISLPFFYLFEQIFMLRSMGNYSSAQMWRGVGDKQPLQLHAGFDEGLLVALKRWREAGITG